LFVAELGPDQGPQVRLLEPAPHGRQPADAGLFAGQLAATSGLLPLALPFGGTRSDSWQLNAIGGSCWSSAVLAGLVVLDERVATSLVVGWSSALG